MRVLVTRPRVPAERTAARLRELGHEPVIDPVLEIRSLPVEPVDPAGVAAVIVTSANALAVPQPELHRLPLFAVGEATARAARATGWIDVTVGPGDGTGLAALIGRRVRPDAGGLLHLAGDEVRPGLPEALAAARFEYRRIVAYTAEPTGTLSLSVRKALEGGGLDAVLLTSARSATLWAAGVRDLTLAPGLVACCISKAVAVPLDGLALAAVRVAEHPDEASLLRCLATPGGG